LICSWQYIRMMEYPMVLLITPIDRDTSTDHILVSLTTGDAPFAVCLGHTVKPQKPTANPLPCATHGKAHTVTRHRQRRPLPCAIYRAHGKRVCRVPLSTHGKKKSSPRNDDVVRPLPCAIVFAHGKDWHLCRVPWFLHTAKVPEPIFFV
jgi:hypothetical protein